MNRIESVLDHVVIQLQNWNGLHSVYGFAAVLVVYVFTVVGQGDAS